MEGAPSVHPHRASATAVAVELTFERRVVDKTSMSNPLHDARVQRGIPLQQVVAATGMTLRIVEALDSGRFAAIPPGIYARSFVRAFATAVGLDPDEALTSLDDCLPKAVELSPQLLQEIRPETRERSLVPSIVGDAALDVSLLFAVSALLTGIVSGYCGVPIASLVRRAPGPMVGLCAPVWIVYEVLLGRTFGQRIFSSGSSTPIPPAAQTTSTWAEDPTRIANRLRSFSNWVNDAAPESLMRWTRSAGSFFFRSYS